jgi:hypothetical protein
VLAPMSQNVITHSSTGQLKMNAPSCVREEGAFIAFQPRPIGPCTRSRSSHADPRTGNAGREMAAGADFGTSGEGTPHATTTLGSPRIVNR